MAVLKLLEWLLFSVAQFLKSLLWRSQYWPQKNCAYFHYSSDETYKYFSTLEKKKKFKESGFLSVNKILPTNNMKGWK